jgi:1,4-dihydroxy-2-naphthoate octaprenyltransferase
MQFLLKKNNELKDKLAAAEKKTKTLALVSSVVGVAAVASFVVAKWHA